MTTFKVIGVDYSIKRVSRWIKIQEAYNITPRHSLYDYAEKYDDGNSVNYFVYKGKKYALNQFVRYGSIWGVPYVPTFNDGDETLYLSGYYADYSGLMIEFDEYCEYVRLYEVVYEEE